jgi:uncharacterized membrane protein YpjA
MRVPDAADVVEYYLGNGPSLAWLLVVNATAFLVGVSFYAHSDPSLADVPTLLYPLFGDSPVALALVTLSLATLLPTLGDRVRDAPINRPLAYLHTLAFVWLVKYGVWTVLALNLRVDLYLGFSGPALWDYWGIVLTHLLFVVEAFVVPYYGRTTPGALAVATVALLVNDVVDYGFGFYALLASAGLAEPLGLGVGPLFPPLRYDPLGTVLPAATVLLTVVVVALAGRLFDRLDEPARPDPRR